MEDFKVRLLDEVCILEDKIHKLEAFVTNKETFSKLSFKLRVATRLQLFFMRHYSLCLAQRIDMVCTPDDIADYATPQTAKTAKPKTKRKNKKTKTNE